MSGDGYAVSIWKATPSFWTTVVSFVLAVPSTWSALSPSVTIVQMGASLRAQGKCHVLGEAVLITLPEMISSSHVSYIMLLTCSQTPVMALQYLSSRICLILDGEALEGRTILHISSGFPIALRIPTQSVPGEYLLKGEVTGRMNE